jgi:hypothetical protein
MCGLRIVWFDPVKALPQIDQQARQVATFEHLAYQMPTRSEYLLGHLQRTIHELD